MLHTRMNTDQILSSDYLDIIYNGHNKSYGGYELRRNYPSRVAKSVLIMLSAGLITAGFGILHAGVKEKTPVPVYHGPTVLTDWHPKVLPLKVLPKKPVQPKTHPVTTQRFTPLVIDRDKNVTPDDLRPSKPEINTPGPKTTEGTPEDLTPDISPKQSGSVAIPAPSTIPKIPYYVEQMPSPLFNLNEYLTNSLHYPDRARESNTQGRVLIRFVVNEDGSISEVTVLKGIGAGCDEEAMRVVAAMPKWKPGKQNGNPVKVYYTLPISFKLE